MPKRGSYWEKKHPRLIRWSHWLNFVLLAVMIWSGLWIYWANDVYRVGIGDFTLFHFFPDAFYRAFNIDHHLAEGMAWHFSFMWLFVLNGLVYVIYNFASGEWRAIVPHRYSFKEAWQTLLHDLYLSRFKPARRKFNGAQQFAYTGIVLAGAGSLLTGLAMYKPTQLAWLTWILGGYELARFEHFWLMLGFVFFFVIHVVQVIRAGWSNFRSMVMGYERVSENQGGSDGR